MGAAAKERAAGPMLLKKNGHIETPHGLGEKRGNKLTTQILAAVAVSLGSLVVGFSTSYSSPALDSMKRPESIIQTTEQQDSWIGSLMPLFALLGGFLGGPIIDVVGRKMAILATAVPFIASFVMISLARDVSTIMAGRAVNGLSVGVASLALPVYLGETIEPRVRGILGLLPTTLGNIGMLISYSAGMYLDWSQLAILGSLLPLPFIITMIFIPETPRWYISKGKVKQGRKSLRWLRGTKEDVSAELSEIQACHEADSAVSKPCTAVFSVTYAKPILTALGLMFFQQLSGINAVIFYSTTIFHDAGSTIKPNVSSIILGVVNVISTLAATGLIDRLGRKVLLYISSTFMIITLIILGWFFVAKEDYDMSHLGWVPLVSFVIYIISFSIGFGPIPWLMMGEILPARIRGPGASLTTAFNWACSFIVTKTFADLKEILGSGGTFWLFACFCTVSIVFIALVVPETKGKSLEDIEKYFITEKPAPYLTEKQDPGNFITEKQDPVKFIINPESGYFAKEKPDPTDFEVKIQDLSNEDTINKNNETTNSSYLP